MKKLKRLDYLTKLSNESLNRLLYESKLKVYALMRRITYFLTIVALGLLVYAHGVVTDVERLRQTYIFIDIILLVFAMLYLVRLLYSFDRKYFLKRTWVEGVLMLLILVNQTSGYLLEQPFFLNFFNRAGIPMSEEIYRVGIACYMLVLLVMEIAETRLNFLNLHFKPATTFIVSFVLLIAIGTGLLMLPKMTTTPDGIRFIDALFMSTSAACVTGLAVIDPSSYLTFNGQVVLLMLVQLGGLGIVSFATFFATFIRQGISLRHHVVMQNMLDSESLFSAKGLFRQIIMLTFGIEALGAIMIFFTWGGETPFETLGGKIFFSIFHSVAAFCNAGFSLFPQGLYTEPVRQAYPLHIVIAFLVIFGGLGFPTILDLMSPSAVRERREKPWKKWKLLTRITIYTSIGLILFGTVMFMLLEYDKVLKNSNFAESLVIAFFQSVSTRTAGFNTIDVYQLSIPMVLVIMFLMFIGGSPGSTGGGIKTTTFFVILLSVWATVRGKTNLEVSKRTIPHSVAYKAFSIFAFASFINLFGLFLLTISEPDKPVLALFFEQISAFATVGLSTGLTAGLSDAGKLIIICSMYLGRVGILTFAIALSTPAQTSAYKYPKAHLVVG